MHSDCEKFWLLPHLLPYLYLEMQEMSRNAGFINFRFHPVVLSVAEIAVAVQESLLPCFCFLFSSCHKNPEAFKRYLHKFLQQNIPGEKFLAIRTWHVSPMTPKKKRTNLSRSCYWPNGQIVLCNKKRRQKLENSFFCDIYLCASKCTLHSFSK